MTLRCKQEKSWRRRLLLGNALVLACSVALMGIAFAEEGTKVPPPPAIKSKIDTSPDPDFKSPMRGFNGRAEEASPPGDRIKARIHRNVSDQGQGPEPVQLQGKPHAGGRVPGLGGPFGAGGGHRQLDLTPLNLTDEQKQHIRAIRSNTREQARELKRSLVAKQIELRRLVFSPDATDDQIRKARHQLRLMQDKMDEIGLNDLLQIRSILTAQQKQKLPDIAPQLPGSSGFGPRGGAAIGQRAPERTPNQ